MVFTTMNIDQLNLAVLVGEKYRKIKAKYLLKIAELLQTSPKNYISRQKLQNILLPYQAFHCEVHGIISSGKEIHPDF